MTEDAVNGTVYGVPLDGGPAVTLATSQHDARFMAVDGANLYWADFNNGASGTIMRVPIGGGTPITISENQLGARAGASRSHKTAHPDHRFRRMPITQNGACRSPIPAHRDRTKRRIPIT